MPEAVAVVSEVAVMVIMIIIIGILVTLLLLLLHFLLLYSNRKEPSGQRGRCVFYSAEGRRRPAHMAGNTVADCRTGAGKEFDGKW